MGGELPDRSLILPLLGISLLTYVVLTLLAWGLSCLLTKTEADRGHSHARGHLGTILCLRYGRDTTLMSEITFVTTLLSMLTIPMLVMLWQ